jgi:hypothetical protein
MMERKQEEDINNLNETVLKGMDVDGIWADIDDHQSKKFHLDKLFNPQGPYFTQTQLYQHEKKIKDKRRSRKKSMHNQGNFLDNIDADIYKDELGESGNYGIASLFEDAQEKEIRFTGINKNKQKKCI